MGLWSKDDATPEGKYPIVLRRDGTPVEHPYFVIVARDPCAEAALLAYAHRARQLGLPPDYIEDVRNLAHEFDDYRIKTSDGDPGAPRHRKDDQALLAWARSLRTRSA